MFGYIVVNQPELRIREYEMYHSYYCGLCRVLKQKYGRIGQITLSYDMTFVLMLLSGLYEPETYHGQSRCIMHPGKKHDYRYNELTEYVADMNVLLSYYKCLDDWKDDKKQLQRLMSKMLEKKTGNSRRKYKQKLEKIAGTMEELAQAEEQNVTDLDQMAGRFGIIMAEIVTCRKDEWESTLHRFGFYLGKFIYLLDAYEDIEEDLKKGRYNPLEKRYGEPDFEKNCQDILVMMMSACCREFEQLPILENVEILRNILYSGIWSRYEAVRAKRMQKAESQENGE